MKLAMSVCVAAAGSFHPRHTGLMEDTSAVVSSDGAVVDLARAQAAYWRTSKGAFAKLSEHTRMAQDNMNDAVTEMITAQESSGDSCHAALYRYRNTMNQLHFQLNMSYSKETTLVDAISAEEEIIKDLEHRINKKTAQFAKRLAECKARKEEACEQFEMYSAELQELQQLGSSPETPIGLFQSVIRQAARQPGRQLQLLGLKSSAAAATAARRVVTASRALQSCISKSGAKPAVAALQLSQPAETTTAVPVTTIEAHNSGGASESDRKFDHTVTFSPEQCEAERAELERTWRKSFLIIEDLVEETGETCNDNTCEETVEEERATQMPLLHEERSTRIETVRKAQKELTDEKANLEDLESALTKLTTTTEQTQEECGAMEKGSQYLEAVRDLLMKMKNCPGLSGAVFQIPAFKEIGELGIRPKLDTDAEIDAKMAEICTTAGTAAGEEYRPAQQSELTQRVVENLPETNPKDVPILGVCPNCNGTAYQGSVTGHHRKCFKAGAGINTTGLSHDCSQQNVAVVCVADYSLAEHNANKEGTTTVAP
eukprot:CAMPEP_0204275526 /NCGR_PEP_ID=MMETSP0468-20130131/26156_1 /ASSEMBLY_ACC=CAM_ASM_000383 /TAXON_ID=2969 /ORGANISM="Oxyrrhis marina" /LENGTH=543 /DNA_ID=CAMNT_0051251883 /DNA_START=83 /DNA_END=1714 /DNA_ORIENTATION=+